MTTTEKTTRTIEVEATRKTRTLTTEQAEAIILKHIAEEEGFDATEADASASIDCLYDGVVREVNISWYE